MSLQTQSRFSTILNLCFYEHQAHPEWRLKTAIMVHYWIGCPVTSRRALWAWLVQLPIPNHLFRPTPWTMHMCKPGKNNKLPLCSHQVVQLRRRKWVQEMGKRPGNAVIRYQPAEMPSLCLAHLFTHSDVLDRGQVGNLSLARWSTVACMHTCTCKCFLRAGGSQNYGEDDSR